MIDQDALYLEKDGNANQSEISPRITLKRLSHRKRDKGHKKKKKKEAQAIGIHAGSGKLSALSVMFLLLPSLNLTRIDYTCSPR